MGEFLSKFKRPKNNGKESTTVLSPFILKDGNKEHRLSQGETVLLNPGAGLPDETPVESVKAVVDLARVELWLKWVDQSSLKLEWGEQRPLRDGLGPNEFGVNLSDNALDKREEESRVKGSDMRFESNMTRLQQNDTGWTIEYKPI